MKLDLENYGCAGKLLSLIILWEGYIDIKLVADVMSENLILEAGDELTAAKLKGELLSLAAVERNAVLEALEVDDNIVAVFCCSVVNADGS